MSEVASPISPTFPSAPGNGASRILSLDLLRGLTIGFMILVNDPGGNGAYTPLEHASWNGCTPTDLVFPTFLFLVGISTVLSLSSRLDLGVPRRRLFLRALRRAFVLYLLGLLVNTFPFTHLDHIRYLGVLPRIAVCYLVGACLLLIDRGWRDKLLLLLFALVGYWALLRFVPVPGYGVPTHDIRLLDRDGNLTAWLDRQVFAPQHLYEQTRDPEGILSTLPAFGTTSIGLLTGLWLRSRRTFSGKVFGIAWSGLACVLLGLAWNVTFPINKKLWTSSYVLFAGGVSLLLLALSMALVDRPSETASGLERSRRTGWSTPLLVFGTNAIAAYVLSELLAATLPSIMLPSGITVQRSLVRVIHMVTPDAALASLIYASSFVLVCWAAIYLLYRRKIFLKI